jgi:hypothetical protein
MRWSPTRDVLEVVFANTGKRWQYPGVTAGDWREIRSGSRTWPMLLQQLRFGRGQPSQQFEKL